MLRTGVCVAAVVWATGCAARGPVRAVQPSTPAADARAAQGDSLEAFMAKVRALSTRARPAGSAARTVEAGDPELAAALLAADARPTAAARRALAAQYARLGIFDKAHEHLTAAVRLDPRDAAGWDGLARIWRDWGFAHLGLADAHRALYFAPENPIVHNTFGTLLQALGRRAEARTHYERALQLDPTAAYALNNLCYGWVLDGQAEEAVRACRRALALQPNVEATRNNLALAYAAGGDLTAAADQFAGSSEVGRAEYNLGIVHLARRQYAEAARAFDAAQARRSNFRAAQVRAREARRRAAAVGAPETVGRP
jgi:Flp pilus assembly protein TadD